MPFIKASTLLKASRILAILLFLGCSNQAPAAVVADAIYTGGPIITMNDASPRVQAVAVKDGKIIAAGSLADVEKLKGAATAAIDLKGRTMLPGFIDGHGHAFTTGIQAASANLLPAPDGQGNSVADLQRLLRAYAQSESAKKFNLILGFGYDDAQLAEKRHPTRHDLDAVSKDLPILIVHQSAHLGVMNTRALELAGLTADTKDPQGGVVRREDDGKSPNGVLEETAFMGAAMSIFPKLNPDQIAQLAVMGQDLYISHGYTTAQEGRATGPAHGSFVQLAQAGRMKIDVVSYMDMIFTDEPPEMKSPWHSRKYNGRYRIGGIKLNLDGSIQGKTGYLTQPYVKPPPAAATNYRGYETLPDQVIAAKVDKAFANGWQILAHCNGDAAIDQYISAVRDATAKHGPADRRNVVIHAQAARPDQLDSMKDLGLMPSFFGMHCFYWGDWHRDETLGPVRAERISPAQSALRRGIIFTQHHDSPVAQPSAIRILSSVVTRRTRSGDILGADERIGVNDALKSLTIWGAYQHFEENEKGSIEVGKVADFVVLSGDPFAIDKEKLGELKVLQTIKAGVSLYTADAAASLPPAQWPAVPPSLTPPPTELLRTATDSNPAATIPAQSGQVARTLLPATQSHACGGCAMSHLMLEGRRVVSAAR
ncbi:amidohydrolase [Humisphaera borealis]|uniref:Amidohydrolase n=1 Tax=Humisphaera borealis TaxID=2807512 RepID=A0A7M2X2C6_9BACT|nr:amidohydrolase [Humisphaera borealis]QOV91917.1 amidohydrolase [Humisphaera borealis]